MYYATDVLTCIDRREVLEAADIGPADVQTLKQYLEYALFCSTAHLTGDETALY